MQSFRWTDLIKPNTFIPKFSRIKTLNFASNLDMSPNTPCNVRLKMTNTSKAKGTLGVRRTKIKGMFREDGEWVTAGTILVKQLGLLYFPGLNVGLGKRRELFAMEHGRVVITTEKVNPKWDSKILNQFYGQYADTDTPIYKTYFHVIADPMPQKFNLVDQI